MPRSVQYVYRSQNLLKLNMQCQRTIPKENTKNKPPSLSKIPRTWSFHVVVSQRTAKKCTKNFNARAQLLFCSLNLWFCGVLVVVAAVVCLSSLLANFQRPEEQTCMQAKLYVLVCTQLGGFHHFAEKKSYGKM